MISDNTFSGNTAPTGQGGAIYLQNESALYLYTGTVSGNSFSGNRATDGGAIYINASGTFYEDPGLPTPNNFVTSGNTFTGNNASSGNGGAIYFDSSGAIYQYQSPNTFTSSDDIFTGNSASNGGAFYSIGGVTLTFTGDTFIANTALGGYGGAIFEDGESAQFLRRLILTSRYYYQQQCLW